jgi:hypothetical protein
MIELITCYGVFILAATLLSWLICHYYSRISKELDQKIREIETQRLWISYFISEFPYRGAPTIINQLQFLNKSYQKLTSCPIDHPALTDNLENLPIIQKARNLADVYYSLILIFGTFDGTPLKIPKLTEFLEEKTTLEESVQAVIHCTDADDFVEKQLALSTLIINMESDLMEYARFLRNDTQRRSLHFSRGLPALEPAAEAIETSEQFIAFFASLFPHEENARCEISA